MLRIGNVDAFVGAMHSLGATWAGMRHVGGMPIYRNDWTKSRTFCDLLAPFFVWGDTLVLLTKGYPTDKHYTVILERGNGMKFFPESVNDLAVLLLCGDRKRCGLFPDGTSYQVRFRCQKFPEVLAFIDWNNGVANLPADLACGFVSGDVPPEIVTDYLKEFGEFQ